MKQPVKHQTKTRLKQALFLFGVFCFICLKAGAQGVEGQLAGAQEANAQLIETLGIEDLLEQLSMDADEETDWTNELEELTDRLDNPLNINEITKEQLEAFPFLTARQIESILAYVYVNQSMQTIYELQTVEEMDMQTIELLRPYVHAAEVTQNRTPIPKDIWKHGKHEVITRLDVPFYKRKAYDLKTAPKSEYKDDAAYAKDRQTVHDNRYLGTPQYHAVRYDFSYSDHLYAGITAEKDAGEPFFGAHNKKGYDHYSFYLYLQNIGRLKALAVGNYRLAFGQGLVISQSLMLGKTTSMTTLTVNNNSIRKHSSTDEYNHLRGAAAAYRVGDFVVSAFYSNRSFDGILNIGRDTITSIQKTGLHRTNREADRRNALTLQLAGTNLSYTHEYLRVGVTGIYYLFDKPYHPPTLLRKYAKYNLHGKAFYNLGLDYRYRWNKLTLQGEVALDKNKAFASINTLAYSPESAYKFMLIHRYYAHNYQAFFARAFSEGGQVQNENGWYVAAELTPLRNWVFFTSADFFSFPWWKYRVDKPSQGFDAILQATYTPTRNINMFVRYRFKQKERNYDEEKTREVLPYRQHRMRYRLNWKITDKLTLRTTIDYTRFIIPGKEDDYGIQLAQMFNYKLPVRGLQAEVHGAYFKTTSYDARVYSSEKALLYTFYAPSFNGRGHRLTANIRWDVRSNIMLMAKLGQTYYHDREVIGTSWDEIADNKKTDLQLQLRMEF